MLGRGTILGVLSSHGLIIIKVRYINVKTYIILNLRSTSLSVPCSGKDDEKCNSSKRGHVNGSVCTMMNSHRKIINVVTDFHGISCFSD